MKNLMTCIGCMALAVLFAGSASAVSFDQNLTSNVIIGDGIGTGKWTVDQDNGVELGLRAKLRHNAAGAAENTYNSNGDGTYSFAAGVAPTQPFPTAVWSFEWSINSDYLETSGIKLDDLTYQLCLDSDISQGVHFTNIFDPINVAWADHGIGDNSTLPGAGDDDTKVGDPDYPRTPAEYVAMIAGNNVAQNSWKAHWFITPFDPTVDATYNIKLSASDSSGVIAQTEIQVIVGAGGEIPEPATMALIGTGVAALAARRKRLA